MVAGESPDRLTAWYSNFADKAGANALDNRNRSVYCEVALSLDFLALSSRRFVPHAYTCTRHGMAEYPPDPNVAQRTSSDTGAKPTCLACSLRHESQRSCASSSRGRLRSPALLRSKAS